MPRRTEIQSIALKINKTPLHMKKILLIILLCVPVLCIGQVHLKGRTVVGGLPRPSYITDAEQTTVSFQFGLDSQTGSSGSVDAGEEPYTPVKDIVEHEKCGTFVTKARYSETYDLNGLVFLFEDEDYIIPIKLVKNDLGAVKRFRSLNLQKGDTLTIRGKLSTIYIRSDSYKGLEDASIIDVRRMEGREGSIADGGEANPESQPFQLVEQKPSFNGGDANEFSKWVNSHLVYPEEAKKNGVQGRVTLQYTIDVDGTLKNVRVLRGVEPSLDKEAVRVVSGSPKWKPGKQRNQPVPVTYTFPVIFQLR